jgi:transcriptional regulator with PAS, ATPase and Fis domain
MERTIILLDGNVICKEDLPQYIRENLFENRKTKFFKAVDDEGDLMTWEEYERLIIEKALLKHGSYNSAGKALGLTHKTVAAKARKYNITKDVG